MFGIKKDKRNIGDFYRELEDATNGKAYGIQLANLLFSMFCGYFQDRTDCIACYGYGGREIFFRATMPEDEAAFYRKDFGQRTDRERIKGNKAVRIWTENGALGGMWVLEMLDGMGMNEGVEDSFREMVSLVQPVFAACLFAEEWKDERMRDCVTGLLGNTAFEETLRRLMEQGVDGYLITARRPALYGRPYTEDGMNRSVRALAKACEKSAVPYIYRISEDAVALICSDGQERAYAVAQELADADSTDVFVTELAALDQDKVYFAIQQDFDRTGEDREAFGLHYPEPKLPIYRDDPKGGWDGE